MLGFNVNDYVVINNTNSEWDNKIGIIKYKHMDIMHIFCVHSPCDLYVVNKNNVHTIKKINL